MLGLKDFDAASHKLLTDSGDAWMRIVSKDLRDTIAQGVVEEGAHHKKLSSNALVSTLFEDASVDDIQFFLTNFDGTRKGLEDFLSHVTIESTNATTGLTASYNGLGMLSYKALSENAKQAYKDTVFTSLARSVKDTFEEINLLPVDRLARVEVQVRNFLVKHKAKLSFIPGMEDSKENIAAIIGDLGEYSTMLRSLDDAKKLATLRMLMKRVRWQTFLSLN